YQIELVKPIGLGYKVPAQDWIILFFSGSRRPGTAWDIAVFLHLTADGHAEFEPAQWHEVTWAENDDGTHTEHENGALMVPFCEEIARAFTPRLGRLRKARKEDARA